MRKIYSIFIITLLLVSTYALRPVISLMRLVVRENMEEELKKDIPENELTLFINLQNNKDIVWETPNEEFHYKSDMYDVVHITHKNGQLYYYCLSDKKEAGLCKAADDILKKQFGKKHSQGDASTKNILKILTQIYIPANVYTHYIIDEKASHQYAYNIYDCYYPDFHSESIAPPPRAA